MRLLLIEDEKALAEAVACILQKNGHQVDVTFDGIDGLKLARTNLYDLIILDVMLPGLSGLEVLRDIRGDSMDTPVLLLTAKASIDERVKGLDAGADDYLTKPFDSDELLARVRALLRRSGAFLINDTVKLGDLELNKDTLMASCSTRSVKLTHRESQILELLMVNKDRILSKERLIEKLWGYDSEAEDNNVEVYISFLRKKLKYLQANVAIVTTRGAGYAMEVTLDV